MNWQDQLITIYLMVCKHYESHLWVYCQRMSNHTDLSFSDEEAITLYPILNGNYHSGTFDTVP